MAAFKLLDAQSALGFTIQQTSIIEREVNQIEYPDVNYAELIPLDFSGGEWAKSVTYYSGDKYGKADWINGNADDIPMAGTTMTKHETQVYTAGIGYGWGLEEISQAVMLGRNLPADDAIAARRAYEEMVYRTLLFGDASKNFTGLFNAPGVTAATAAATWDTATPDQIIADMNNMLIGQFTGTLFTSMADTLLLPYDRFLNLASTPRSNESDTSILTWYLANNPYTALTGRPLRIRGVQGLQTTGAGGTHRAVAYRRDPNVVKAHIPMPHRFLPVYQAGPLRWEVPGIFRLGGTDVRRPLDVSYLDAI